MLQAVLPTRTQIRARQTHLFVRRERPTPGAVGEIQGLLQVPGFGAREGGHDLLVMRAQRCHEGLHLGWQHCHLRRVHVLNSGALQLHAVMFGEQAKVGVVVRPAAEQIVPRLI